MEQTHAHPFAELTEGGYVWVRSPSEGRWCEAKVAKVSDEEISIRYVGVGTVADKQWHRIAAKDETRRRSIWPGEEDKKEFHANLASMRYLNSPEVAANLSLGINPERTVLTSLGPSSDACNFVAATSLRAKQRHLPLSKRFWTSLSGGESQAIVFSGTDISLKRAILTDLLALPVLSQQDPELSEKVSDALEVLSAFTDVSMDLPSPTRAVLSAAYVFGPDGGVGAQFAVLGLDRTAQDSITGPSMPSFSVLHAVQSLAQRGDDALRSNFFLKSNYSSLNLSGANAHPRPPMEEILGTLEQSFGIGESGSRSLLEALATVLWLASDAAPPPPRLVGLSPDACVQLRELGALQRRALAEEIYVSALDWVLDAINRTLRLPLASGSKHSALQLLLLPAPSCSGNGPDPNSDGNWRSLVHNYVNMRAHLAALKAEERRLRAALESDDVSSTDARRTSAAVAASERCLDLFEQILDTHSHADAVLEQEGEEDAESVRRSRAESAQRAARDLFARIDGNAALLAEQAADGAIGVAHWSCDAKYRVLSTLPSRSAPLPMPLRLLLSSSRNPIIAAHFSILNERGAALSSLQRWRTDGHALQHVLDSAECTFIHCVNPSEALRERLTHALDERLVHAQLSDQWFCDFAELIDAYLPVRLSHAAFMRACNCSVPQPSRTASLIAAEDINLAPESILFGETHVYLSRGALATLRQRGAALLEPITPSTSSSASSPVEFNDASSSSSSDSAPSIGDEEDMIEKIDRGSSLMQHQLPPPAPSMHHLALEHIARGAGDASDATSTSSKEKRKDSVRSADRHADAIVTPAVPITPGKVNFAERQLRTAISMKDLSEVEESERRAKMDANTEIGAEEEQLFRAAGLPARHLELLLKLSRASASPPSSGGSVAAHFFVDAKITEDLVRLSDASLSIRLASLSVSDTKSGESHFVAMLYIWRTLQAVRIVLRPDPLAPHVHSERLNVVRGVGLINKIAQLLHRMDTYMPILRDALFHAKLELLCADVLLAFVGRSNVKDANCTFLGTETNFTMLARTLETKLRHASWASPDARLFIARLVQLLCVLLANERSLSALQKDCKEKRKRNKASDTLSATLCACTNLLLGSPDPATQLQGIKLMAHAAPIASGFYRSLGVLEALLEPLHNRSAEYVHDAGAALLHTRTASKKKTKLLEDAIACGAVKALVGALARPEREVREKSLLLLCTLCCPTLLGKAESKRNFLVAAKYLTPLGPSAPLLLQTAAREPTRAALEALLTLLDQSASRVASLRVAVAT